MNTSNSLPYISQSCKVCCILISYGYKKKAQADIDHVYFIGFLYQPK